MNAIILVYNELLTLASITQTPCGGSIFSPSNPSGDLCSVNVTTRAALPQNRVETPSGSQTNYEIKTKIRIHFYKIILRKVFNIELIVTQK